MHRWCLLCGEEERLPLAGALAEGFSWESILLTAQRRNEWMRLDTNVTIKSMSHFAMYSLCCSAWSQFHSASSSLDSSSLHDWGAFFVCDIHHWSVLREKEKWKWEGQSENNMSRTTKSLFYKFILHFLRFLHFPLGGRLFTSFSLLMFCCRCIHCIILLPLCMHRLAHWLVVVGATLVNNHVSGQTFANTTEGCCSHAE